MSGAHWIMPLARQEEHFRSMIGTGRTLRFPRCTSASSLPEVAAGFGRTVFEFTDGHRARSIGNSLHEAVLPPGTYEVVHVEREHGQARAPIDGRTMFRSEHVRVMLRRTPPEPLIEFPARAAAPAPRPGPGQRAAPRTGARPSRRAPGRG
jgi:hypothetical protein